MVEIQYLKSASGYNYFTPEDVQFAINNVLVDETNCGSVEDIRMEVLAIIGGLTEYALEDASLCACLVYMAEYKEIVI